VRAVGAIEVVLFDLGGVLIDFNGVGAMRELAGIDDEDEAWRRWLSCRWVRDFERGACSIEAFSDGVVADWALPIDGPAFATAFSGWVGDELPGAGRLVAETQAAVPVGCLSNSNALHWEHRARWPFLEELDFRFLSFQLGVLKPDRDLFERVAELLPVDRAAVLFLDDNQINVDGAVEAGFQAARTRGVTEARSALESTGVLPTR
jgi:FMN phosphatase YigB (HAD superfamily)